MGQDDGSWFMAHGSRLMAKGGRPGPGARGSARSGDDHPSNPDPFRMIILITLIILSIRKSS